MAGGEAKKSRKRPVVIDVRKAKYLKGRMQGKSAQRAALDAGYSRHYAKSITRQKSVEQTFRRILLDEFDKLGITPEYLAQKEFEMLESPDEQIVSRALDRHYKLHGAIGSDDDEQKKSPIIEIGMVNVQLNNIVEEADEKLRRLYEQNIRDKAGAEPARGEEKSDGGEGSEVFGGVRDAVPEARPEAYADDPADDERPGILAEGGGIE